MKQKISCLIICINITYGSVSSRGKNHDSMKTYQKQLAIGLLLLAVLQKVLGQSEGLDDRYRTEDTFREPDNRPGQAFDTFEKQTTDLVPKKGATKGGVTIYEVQVKPAVEG